MNTASFEEMLQECLHNCTECHQICLQVSVSTEVVGKLGAGDVKGRAAELRGVVRNQR